jgi:periplasmic protein TonB
MKKYPLFAVAIFALLNMLILSQNIRAQDANEVYEKVDVFPEYPGGTEALIKSIVNEIKYPEEAMKEGVEGRVLVKFVVDKQGIVTEAKVIEGIGKGCDEEAMRVVNMLKQFKPGIKDGKPVNTKLVVPIMFKLADKK